MKNCLLCGVGGQGTVLASRIIAAAAMAKGLETCGGCGAWRTCEKLSPIIGNNPDALRRLESWK